MHASLRALGVTRLSQLPEHVPVVRWDWVVTGFSGKLGPLFEYAAFADWWKNFAEKYSWQIGDAAMACGADGYGDGCTVPLLR